MDSAPYPLPSDERDHVYLYYLLQPPGARFRTNNTASNNPQQTTNPPQHNSFRNINPFYTQQQPYDAFAPMRMYRNYQQTGQLPGYTNSFTPFEPPQAADLTQAGALTTSQTGSVGGQYARGGK